MSKPMLIKAGDKRVLIKGNPVLIDFRIVAEHYYQGLISERADHHTKVLEVIDEMSWEIANSPSAADVLTGEMNRASRTTLTELKQKLNKLIK